MKLIMNLTVNLNVKLNMNHILFFGLIPVFLAAPSPVRAEAGSTAASKPLHHIVLLQFREGTAEGEVRQVLREFQRLPEQIPGIIGFQWGTDNSPEGLQKGFTHVFLMTFRDVEALEAYLPHPVHQAFANKLRPLLDGLFVFDFPIDRMLPPLAPGRVHHLVFFRYSASAGADRIARITQEFARLPLQIPGLLRYQAGRNVSERGLSMDLTHGHVVSFVHGDARDDYIPHPAHRAFVEIVKPVLEDVLVVDFTVRPSGRSLLVTEGLEPYRVYQRNEEDEAKLEFAGLASGDGAIEARLLSGRRVVEGFDWQRVGKASAGSFRGALEGVPAGGAYTVEIRRRDTLGNVAEITRVANLLVGDIWILAGQSNMQGVGNLEDVEPPHPRVHCFTMSHRWELARDPLHWLIDSRDAVHYGRQLRGLDEEGRREKRARERQSRKKGAGLGLPFARFMVEETGIPVGLLAAAHGGTSMSQWDPDLREKGGESLYGSMLKQVRRAGGRVKGVLWYQGESDANPEAAPLFRQRFKNLVAATRRDLGQKDLPFYYVQIGRFVVDGRDAGPWKTVQEAQRTAAREIDDSEVVSVIDLSLDDPIHVGTEGLKRAGARLGRIALCRLFGDERLEIGPRLAGIEVEEGGATLRVRYTDVNGALRPRDNVTGFSIRQADGTEVAAIYRASVDPDRPDTVILGLRGGVGRLPADAAVWYGAGFDPVCNLVDQEDMAALAFGPVRIGGKESGDEAGRRD